MPFSFCQLIHLKGFVISSFTSQIFGSCYSSLYISAKTLLIPQYHRSSRAMIDNFKTHSLWNDDRWWESFDLCQGIPCLSGLIKVKTCQSLPQRECKLSSISEQETWIILRS